MPSIVFFGLDGRFSTILLEVLVRAELRPSLVVVGRERSSPGRGARVRFTPATPPWWRRALGLNDAGRAPGSDPIELRAAALAMGIDVLEAEDPGALRARAQIRAYAPTCFVVAGFHRLLPRAVLELAERGGLNVHPGRLPEERGPAPIFWLLKSGRTRGEVSVHVLDPGEDTGDVVAKADFEFRPGASGRQVLELAAGAAAPHLVRSVRALLAGDLVRIPQARDGAGRCPRPSFRDCRVDPRRSAAEVYTFVAGCAAAYPVFVECGGDRFFIESADTYDATTQLDFEYFLCGDHLILSCNPGVVELRLKPEGALFTAEYEDESEGAATHLSA